MNLPLRLLDRAKQEAHAEARWYERRQSGLGQRFLRVLREALLNIEQRPTGYPHLETVPVDVPVHRAITKSFPYLVIYELRSDEVLVLAIAHAKRRPNYWMRRLCRIRRLAGHKFRRQHSFGPYCVDFYCAERQLGLHVLRISNEQVELRTADVLEALVNACRDAAR